MKRSKIDYGIDLGTTNSALARMESGEPSIKKTDTLKDTLPSCVGFNKKKTVILGDPAFNQLRSDTLAALKAISNGIENPDNYFTEFKRTMGTDKVYWSENYGDDLSSEELSAEILKKLRSLVLDEQVSNVVITVPAKFTANQKDATMRAAKLAGFEYCELLQEPIAAAIAYGLGSEQKDGRWLIFDMGGGTFDAALMRVEEGIIKVEDTEGDNYLGGKNIDLVVVDDILLPHLQKNFQIDRFLGDPVLVEYLRKASKVFAEPAKIQLSFTESCDILSDPGDFPEDDEGTEIELDLKLTRELLFPAERPIFQRAIDICLDLLKRNDLTGDELNSLILVGGPTHSSNLRQMLREQITEKVDAGIDPMTAVARGAALYASTISIPDAIRSASADLTKIQLDIKHETTTVEDNELVTIHVVGDAATGSGLFIEIDRGDKGWSSGRSKVGEFGEVIEVELESGRANFFTVSLFDDLGNRVPCEPEQFTILQGTKVGGATLPYHFGIEIRDADSDKLVFVPIKGLEKNKSYPATGVKNDLKTQKPAGPGVGEILIPLYEGDADAMGTRAIFSEHVYDAVIHGDELPAFLPAGSPVELTVNAIRDGEITIKAYFPTLEETITIPVDTENLQTAETSDRLYEIISDANEILEEFREMNSHIDPNAVRMLQDELVSAEGLLDQSPEDYDRRMQVRNRLREIFRKLDNLEKDGRWPKVSEELKNTLELLKRHIENVRSGLVPNDVERYRVAIAHFEEQSAAILETKDMKSARRLIDEMNHVGFKVADAIHGVSLYIDILHSYDANFDTHNWSDRNRARLLVNQGLGMAVGDPTREEMLGVLRELFSLLPESERKTSHLTGDIT